MATEQYLTTGEKKLAGLLEEPESTKLWRPRMAYMYMAICVFDFMVAPILWSLVQIFTTGMVALPWTPLTLAEGGIFHMALGAILGAAAFTRGQEKVQRLRSVTSFEYSPPENPYRLPPEDMENR